MRIRVSISPREAVSRMCNEITQAVQSIFSSRTYARMILAEESLRFHTVMMYILMITHAWEEYVFLKALDLPCCFLYTVKRFFRRKVTWKSCGEFTKRIRWAVTCCFKVKSNNTRKKVIYLTENLVSFVIIQTRGMTIHFITTTRISTNVLAQLPIQTMQN